MTYQLDSSGECITTDNQNARAIAFDLTRWGQVVTTWADEDGSKFDLMWSYRPLRVGRSSMVDQGRNKLYIGVLGCGAFGFGLSNGYLAPDYVREKLGVGGGVTAQRLADLISRVRTIIATTQ